MHCETERAPRSACIAWLTAVVSFGLLPPLPLSGSLKFSTTLVATLIFIGCGGVTLAQESGIEPLVDAEPAVEDRPLQLPENTNEDAEGSVGDWKDPAEFVRSHWVRMTAAGELVGRIQTIDPDSGRAVGSESLTIELYQKGKRVGDAQTGSDGSFTIGGLQPGVYALIARGDTGFLAYGLQLLPSLDQAGLDSVIRLVQAPIAKPVLEIQSAAIPPTFRQLKTILEENYSKMRSFYVPEEAYRPFLASAAKQKESGWDQQEGPDALRGTKQLATSDTDPGKTVGATSVYLHPVVLSDDGTMYGRLYGIDAVTGRPRNVKKTTVYIIRNDKLITSTEVDEKGYFRASIPRPSVYALVAAGEDGFGALSFRAIQQPKGVAVSRVPSYDDLTRLVGGQLPDAFDEPPIEPMPRPAPAAQVRDAAGGREMAGSFAMALIDDPDTIAAAMQPWTGQQAIAAGGMFDAGFAGPAGTPMSAPSEFAGSGGGYGGGSGFGGGGAIGGGLLGGALVAGITATAIALANDNNNNVVSPFNLPIGVPNQPVAPPTPPPTVLPPTEG